MHNSNQLPNDQGGGTLSWGGSFEPPSTENYIYIIKIIFLCIYNRYRTSFD